MSERVLVVESNAALAEDLAELMRGEGLEVSVSLSAREALASAAGGGFAVALVDIGIAPGGLDLVELLRSHSPHGEIILMTGNVSLRSALQAIERGVYGYLTKPFEALQLMELVKRGRAQADLKREKHALTGRLAASEALYRSVVDTVDAAILGVDAEGTIRLANRNAGDCLGHLAVGLLGRSLPSLCERSEVVLRAIERAARGQLVRDVEGRHPQKSGVRTLRWNFTPLVPPEEAESEAAPSVLAIGLDITERLLLESKSADAQALAAMGTLTTSLAHEIRNPLNAASLQLELLARRARRSGDADLDAQLAGPVELVRTELARLSSLLDEFLLLARPTLPVRRRCRLAPIVADVLALEEPVAAAASVRLRSDVACELVARVDADKLKQALLNVIRNAIEALTERGGLVSVTAGVEAGGGVVLAIEDDGPGMSAELRDTALQPFLTTKPGGTGLGLSIVHKIIAQHGGVVELLAAARGGTTVRLRIAP